MSFPPLKRVRVRRAAFNTIQIQIQMQMLRQMQINTGIDHTSNSHSLRRNTAGIHSAEMSTFPQPRSYSISISLVHAIEHLLLHPRRREFCIVARA